MTTLTCMLCKRAVEEGELPVPGIALCGACLAQSKEVGEATFIRGPWFEVRTAFMFGAAFLGFLAGLEFGGRIAETGLLRVVLALEKALPFVNSFLVSFTSAATIAIVSGVVSLNAAAMIFQRAFGRRIALLWKERLLRELGVPPEAASSFELAQLLERRPRIIDTKLPMDIGLLARGEGGLAFLGGRGTRIAIPLSNVRRATTERLLLAIPSVVGLRLDLAGGDEHLWIFFEGEGAHYGSDAARAREVAAEIRERLAQLAQPAPSH